MKTFLEVFSAILFDLISNFAEMSKKRIQGVPREFRVCRENFDTAHRKVDGIKMNIKVPYHFAIFAIIMKILIYEIVLKSTSRETFQPLEV